jgi:hypothetical protein
MKMNADGHGDDESSKIQAAVAMDSLSDFPSRSLLQARFLCRVAAL